MNKISIPLICLITGIIFIIIAVLSGKASIAVFVVFPIVYGGGIFMLLGILFIFLSFILFFFIPYEGYTVSKRRKYHGWDEVRDKESSYGGVIFIGPIPIVFGKDESITTKMLYLALIIAVLLVLVYTYFIIFR